MVGEPEVTRESESKSLPALRWGAAICCGTEKTTRSYTSRRFLRCASVRFWMSDESWTRAGFFADSGWRVDPGIEFKVRVPGSVGAVFFFGRDLRAGRNAFYATAF